MPSCCGCAFPDGQALKQHQAAKHLYSCQQCNRSFGTQTGLNDHNRDCHGSPSLKAEKSPSGTQATGRLIKNNGDCYCGACQRLFVDSAALTQHLQSAVHASEFRCCDCERNFVSMKALMQHLRDKVHNPRPTRAQNKIQTCQECNRQFRNEEALRQHQSSSIHQPARSFGCAAGGAGGQSCGRRFGSPAAMLQHLESGACSSGMDRHKLNLMVLRSDTEGLISNPAGAVQGLLGEATRQLAKATRSGDATLATDSRDIVSLRSGSSTGGVILTPSSSLISSSLSSPILTPTSGYSPAVTVFIKGGTRCALCPPTRRPFPTPQSLQQHLQSPAHDARIFHCPVSTPAVTETGRQVKPMVKWFSTVSGMGQHVESGACAKGGPGFGNVLRNLETRVREVGLAIRLAISE
ncbi:hypothetical protein B0H67DRAFT_595103 [Lasiosphaeris hirsuta]|uniref:C2H2-type domain-containing protein n=1 Tax=Lasiosphaeris hirsuta TaxID=260670 RepID=A0AA40DJ91_9PEZI|nr:hypothetical protein B0H67DRAFT_595103 [Lasiosphaeris hirsuta]